jgi:hypothetical protein
MRAPFRLGRLIFAVALLLTLALAGGSPGSAVVTRTGHDFTYYSNASHTTVVGYCIVCVGYSSCHGTITPYYTIGNYPCQ